MRIVMIESYIRQLVPSLGGVRETERPEKLRKLYQERDFVGMVRHIRAQMGLNMKVRVGFVNSGGPANSSAWIVRPGQMPFFGTPDFQRMEVTIYLRKSFLADAPFEAIVLAIAHEFTHVVLDAIGHALNRQEAAVDLAAMLLGFRDFYRSGCRYQVPIKPPQQSQDLRDAVTYLLQMVNGPSIALGYLTSDEVHLAASIMDRQVGQAVR